MILRNKTGERLMYVISRMHEKIRAMNVESVDCELRVEIARGLDCWLGTAQQLRDERLLPDDVDLPPGRVATRWHADGFAFWLRRVRPPGAKRGAWGAGDYWRLERTSLADIEAQRVHLLLLIDADRDERFQAFLRVAGLKT
ncbi:MAG TPA: hypothetical protein VMG60_05250 [Burkholderiaceae bacterium]|nr:hypothetical protein [Burkholderiaceae bacterium]